MAEELMENEIVLHVGRDPGRDPGRDRDGAFCAVCDKFVDPEAERWLGIDIIEPFTHAEWGDRPDSFFIVICDSCAKNHIPALYQAIKVLRKKHRDSFPF